MVVHAANSSLHLYPEKFPRLSRLRFESELVLIASDAAIEAKEVALPCLQKKHSTTV